MSDKEQDPNLQAPQEANTTKHINFLAAEDANSSDLDNKNDGVDDDSPTKKAWEELRNDSKKEDSTAG